MSESRALILPIEGAPMPKAYTCDLRKRVILAVELGTSRREAAEHFNISASSAVKWLQCWRDNGTASPKPRGGSVSRLERHLKWILDLVAAQPDLTLDEMVEAMRKRRIRGSRTALWRFLDRHNITVKKKSTGERTTTRGRGSGASPLDSRSRLA